MRLSRPLTRIALLCLSATTAGCAALTDLLNDIRGAPDEVPLAERPVEAPIDANRFVLDAHTEVVGEVQLVFTNKSDTFSDLARTYGLGYDELIAANPGIDPWLPGEGTAVLLPTQFVLPRVERRGIVLNIATKRLFYFPQAAEGEAPEVLTYPIGIGRVGWETPLGESKVIDKAKDPTWWVPASVRKEHAEAGNPLPAVVPAGPDNPLGHRVLKLDMPGYLIHGTNQPYGVGMRVSHGCVRLYPENIEVLYELVDRGVAVQIISEPYLIGNRDGFTYFEAHAPLEDDEIPAAERLAALLDSATAGDGAPLNRHLREHIALLAATPKGVPVNVTVLDADEVLSRARVVQNVIEANPDEYTLEEIREMMTETDDETG